MTLSVGIDLGQAKRKPRIIKLIQATDDIDDEITEAVEWIREKEAESRKREQEERDRKKQADEEARQERESKKRADEIALRNTELEMKRLESASSNATGVIAEPAEKLKMKDLLQPYKLGEDIGLFLVNFERTCEKMKFQRETWSQKLLTLLPCEAADVIARLSKEEADDYVKVKAALLKKYRLSTEAFRQRFRHATRKPTQSWPEFAYNLKADLVEWLKRAGAHGDHDKVLECVATEQLFTELSEPAKFWVQDRLTEVDLLKAPELAEEYAMRRGQKRDPTDRPKGENRNGNAFSSQKNGTRPPLVPFFCDEKAFPFRCGQPGHFAASCTKKVAFHYVRENEDNEKLLEPYTREMVVNGQKCRVLRDSAATMDVVHPSYVRSGDYTGDCAWIRQAVEEQSVCLPIAKIMISGPFGILETEAASGGAVPAVQRPKGEGV
ncbi:uncharacterized protein LOC120840506 [Ixodes scapularis]|uniref:uncharacterized protein LOC120840506 n=1 Tax=Ixodes scapularis TaxID=6945 RepID=UPI001A9CC76C|nr:uncharacterized protein LOC120840506 [Ixodes scapularis]